MSGRRYVARNAQVAARRLGDEMMIMSASDSMLFTLNDAAAMIWEAADGKTPLDEIVENGICREYEVAPEEALKDAEELAEQLASQGILVISDKPIGDANAAAGGFAMSRLMEEMSQKALRLRVPLSVQLDLTYRCNERCIHCYLDHEDHGEMTTAEIKELLDQMAEAGVFFLTISGGEILMRRDLFEILEYARAKLFSVKLKTNAVMIREKEAERIQSLGVESVQVSIYSNRAEVHDAITKLPGSLRRSLNAIRLMRDKGLHVIIANVLMLQNFQDYPGVKALAAELGVQFTMDPTITPRMDGDRSILNLNIDEAALRQVFRDESLIGNVEEFCAPPTGVDEDALDSVPCSAGHTACYVSPYGDVYPCVQFPLPSGSVRRSRFIDIWRDSRELNEVRSITLRDLPSCSRCTHATTCTRCPGLAYMEGNMRGPSYQDCEKSFARTGIPSENLKSRRAPFPPLVQIQSAYSGGAANRGLALAAQTL